MTNTRTNDPTSLALVVGGTGAIGNEAVRRLSDQFLVVGTYRHRAPADTERYARWIHYETEDRSSAQSLRDALASAGMPLRFVLIALGAASSKRHVSDTASSEFADVYRGNVEAIVRAWHLIAERARTDKSSVVIIGSEAAQTQRAGNGPYSAAKLALEGLVKTLAKEEFQHGIRFNIVSPSLVRSPLAEKIIRAKGVSDPHDYYEGLPWGRPLEAGEVAEAAIDIGTAPHWQYATGQVFRLAVAHDV